jgi:purine-binding chemotaxis protein CheW
LAYVENPTVTGVHLFFRVASQACALPAAQVEEIMRPMPIDAVAGLPPFILGVSLIRGTASPVIDARRLLLGHAEAWNPRRFVTLRLGARHAALAVDEVLGVRAVPDALTALPPLLADVGPLIAGIARLDAELMLVLKTGRMVPEEIWDGVIAGGARA